MKCIMNVTRLQCKERYKSNSQPHIYDIGNLNKIILNLNSNCLTVVNHVHISGVIQNTL